MNRRLGCGCGGCLGASLLGVVAAALLGYFLVWVPVSTFLAGWRTPPAQTATLPPAPSAAALASPATRAEVQAFVRVRRAERTALGSSFTALQRVSGEIQAGQAPSLLGVLGVLREVGGTVGAARSAQSQALIRERLSAERYAVLRGRVNRALGVPNVNLGQVAEALGRGQLPDLSAAVPPADPQQVALVAPFRQELLVTAPLGLLGL
jgi:hypothetical protein